MRPATQTLKSYFINVTIFFVTLAFGLLFIEGVLRIKNRDQKNYDIEMWRYAKLLKVQSNDPNLGHLHRPSNSAVLQGVEIRINSLGMRGPEPDLTDTTRIRILFLGSSNTLGWGVAESDTMTALVQNELAAQAQVFNAGIGNYNTLRYVSLLEKKLLDLKPDIVVVNYFINDAEKLSPGGGNFLLRNSQLAVLTYQLSQTMSYKSKTIDHLADYYRNIYQTQNEGHQLMQASLKRLAELAKEKGFKVIFTMVPDIHKLHPYPFQFIHDEMKETAASYGWTSIDFIQSFSAVSEKDLWAMPGDPHLNKLGHKMMAETLLPYLK